MNCSWAEDYPELQEACSKSFQYDLTKVNKFKFRTFPSLLQEGPQCGLVTLAMCSHEATKENVFKMFEVAKSKGYTLNGEMFSCKYLLDLARTFISDKNIKLFNGNLNCDYIKQFLLGGGCMLVPYDNDKNFTPCLNKGHTAHWALICGILEIDEFTCFVLAKHGKSKRLAVWSLEDLANSNQQLLEFSPDRKLSDVDYILPEGGIAGAEGLNGNSLLIYNH